MPSFIKIVQAVQKLNSISRAQLSIRRRSILCTTSYRNLMQASNFGGTFDQLFLSIFLWSFHRRCLSTSSIPWCKKVKNDQKLEAILVIFGRRALIFLFESSWKSMQKMTPLLCACALVITMETQKCRKWAPHSVEFNFLLIAIEGNGFCKMKEEGLIYKSVALEFLIIA